MYKTTTKRQLNGNLVKNFKKTGGRKSRETVSLMFFYSGLFLPYNRIQVSFPFFVDKAVEQVTGLSAVSLLLF
jgi:hypothetical protein